MPVTSNPTRFSPGDVFSYLEMCREEGLSLQRGMNFHARSGYSVILMSRRQNAPYTDMLKDEGRTLIYEGHDTPQPRGGPDPKTLDQVDHAPHVNLTQNGLFYEAAEAFRKGQGPVELVKVYEKILVGIWTFNGIFRLVDAWKQESAGRQVFKFKLESSTDQIPERLAAKLDLLHTRTIPREIKLAVWQRDKGQCQRCGSKSNLHFDHDIPYSLGGTSILAQNVQLLCAKCNLSKHNRIE
jgi:hypothetical protein